MNGELMASEGQRVPPGSMSQARIVVEGHDTDTESLGDWLRHEPELRGRLWTASTPTPDGAMGVPMELVVVLASAIVPVATALARSIPVWLTQREIQRNSDITVTVTGAGGRQVSVTAKRVADSEKLLCEIREILESPVPPAADAEER